MAPPPLGKILDPPLLLLNQLIKHVSETLYMVRCICTGYKIGDNPAARQIIHGRKIIIHTCLLFQMMVMEYCRDLQEYMSQIRIPVFLSVILFAMSSWIVIFGLWTELPLLVNVLPESWNLPSYMILVMQIANIGPVIYTLANRLSPNKVKEWPVIYVIMSMGIVASFLLILSY